VTVNSENPGAPENGSADPALPDMDDLVAVGRIGRPHGLKGEVRVNAEPGCDGIFPEIERFYVGARSGMLELTTWRVRLANKYVIVGFDGYRSRDEAERLRDKDVYVRTDDLPELEEGDVYQYTQVGARLVDETGTDLGTVEEIIDTVGHPVFRVAGPEGEFLFPATPPWILGEKGTDEGAVITVKMPEGLLDAQRGGGSAEA
jgi:16S rRNA processing protein RimM